MKRRVLARRFWDDAGYKMRSTHANHRMNSWWSDRTTYWDVQPNRIADNQFGALMATVV